MRPVFIPFLKRALGVAVGILFGWFTDDAASETADRRMTRPHLVQRGPVARLDYVQPWIEGGLPELNRRVKASALGTSHANPIQSV